MTRRVSSFVIALPLAAGVAFAQQPPQAPPQETPRQPAQAPPDATQKPATGTMEVPADVIAADVAAKTITVTVLIRSESGGPPSPKEVTIPVDAEALESLKTVNPGDKVKLLCRTNDTGKVTAVKGIRPSDKPPTH
jgi:hypothetical protein